MADNIYNLMSVLIDNAIDSARDNGDLAAKVNALHRLIDIEDVSNAKEGYLTRSFSTDNIRAIFGWEKPPKLVQIEMDQKRKERERCGNG